MTAPFVTVEEVKSYLPIRSGNYEFDQRLTNLILTASTQIEKVTNRSFKRQVYVQTFDSVNSLRQFYDIYNTTNETGLTNRPRTQMFNLRGFPVDMAQPTEVRYDPAREFGDGTVVPADEWTINPSVNTLILRAETGEHPQSLRLTYTAGYEADAEGTLSEDIPADLKLACSVQVVHLFNRTQPDNVGVDTSRGDGKNQSARWNSNTGLSAEVLGMIRHYKALALGKG